MSYVKLPSWFLGILFIVLSISTYAKTPELTAIKGLEPNGRYNVGDQITIAAEFSDFLSVSNSSSPSSLKVVLDTGPDDQPITIPLTMTTSNIIDDSFGVKGVRNMNNNVNSIWGIYQATQLSSGDIVLVGYFTEYEGIETRYAVVTDSNGKIKRTFGGAGTTNGYDQNPYFSDSVTGAYETSEGKIILTGEFANYDGKANYDYLVQFNSDWSIDTNFMNNLTTNNTVRPFNYDIGHMDGSYYTPNTPIAEHDGKLYIAGRFTQFKGNSDYNKLVKLNLDGTLDSTFKSPIINNYDANSLVIDDKETSTTSDDKLYVVGDNMQVMHSGTRKTSPVWRMALNGTIDDNFLSAITSATTVGGVMVMPDNGVGTIAISGMNMSGTGVSPTNGALYVLNDSGGLETGWAKQGVQTGWGADAFQILKGKLFLGVHNGLQGSEYGNRSLAVFNLNDGTINNDFMNVLGQNVFNNGGDDVHDFELLKDGGLLVTGTFCGVTDTTSPCEQHGIVKYKFNSLKGTHTVRSEPLDLTGRLKATQIKEYQVDSIFGGSPSTTAPTLASLTGGSLEDNSLYSLNRLPTDPHYTTLIASPTEIGTNQTITVTLKAMDESNGAVGKSGDDVTFAVSNPKVTVSSITDKGNGDYTVSLSTSETVEQLGTVSATVNGLDVENNGTSKAAVPFKFLDITPPAVLLAADKSQLSGSQSSTVTITLSEASTNFALTDLTVSGGSLSAFTGSGTSYQVVFTPTAGSTANGVVNIVASKLTDAAGNDNTASNIVNFTVDTAKPTAAISTSPASLKAGETSTLTITLSEVATDFTLTDVTATGGTLGTFNGSGMSYTAIFTPTNNSTTAGNISIAADKFTDPVGNNNQASNIANLTIDTVKPTVTLTALETSLGAGETSTITVTLSESATDFTETDLTATGGTLSAFTGSGKSYSVTFTPISGSTVNGAVSVTANKFTDAMGNGNIASAVKTYTVDTGKPGITISASPTSLGGSQTSTVTFTLSEASTDFAIADVTAIGGTLSAFTGSGTSYSATFTPTAGSTSAGSVTVTADKFTDAGGNENTVSNTVTFTIDTAKPTASIVPSPTSLKAGETSTITVTLSESATDFVLADLTVIGGTLATFNGSGKSYTAVFTPAVDSTTAGQVNIAANKFTDASGNMNAASSTANVNVDTKKPTAALTAAENALGAGQTSVITIALSESSSDFTLDDLTVSGGTLGSFSGSGSSYRVTFTPALGSTASGRVSIGVGKFADAAGNGNIASTEKVFTINTTMPTITLSASSNSLGMGQTSTISMVLSEASTNFTIADITASGGTLSGFTGSGVNYSVVFTPSSDSTDTGIIRVVAGKFTDASGNNNLASVDLRITVDTAKPSATLAASPTKLKSGQTSTIDITLTETATDFTLSDVTATGGTLSAFNGSGKSYTMVFTPTDISTTNGVIVIAANKFTDAAGNVNTVSNRSTITIDTVKPTVTLTAPETKLGSGDTSTVTISLSESSESFSVEDITASGGSLSAFSGSGTRYTVVFTPSNNSNNNGSVTVVAGKFTDAAGNSNVAASTAKIFTIDTAKPSITLSASSTSLGGSQTSTITMTLSEASTDFTVADITVSGGTLSSFAGSGTRYNVTFTPTGNSISGGRISVAAAGFTDEAGNANTDSNTVVFTVDTAKPTATLVPNPTSLKADETSTITITLTEPATDFTLSDITVFGGSVGTFNGSGARYTLVFTPSENSVASGRVSIAAGQYTDAAGNANTVSNTASISVDTKRPTATLTASESALAAGQSSVVTITLSESASDFTFDDLTVSGGTLGSLSGSGANYSVTFTPVTGSTTSGTISVGAGKFTDAAGNSNVASAEKVFAVNTTKPTITLSASSNSLGMGQTSTITVVLSEASTNFTVADITPSGGTLSGFTGSGVNYTVVFTPASNSTSAGIIRVAAGQFTDAAGNTNLSSIDLSIAVDTAKPTASLVPNPTSLKAGETSTVAITLTEAATDFSVSDLTASGGTLGTFNGSGTQYSVVFTPSSNSTAAGNVSIAANTFTDAAGNANTVSNTANISVDTKRPTATLSAAESALAAGQSSIITISLSESASDFSLEDLTVSGGNLTSFSGMGASYSVTFTPAIGSTTSGRVSVGVGKFTDAAGNSNVASTEKVFTINTTTPTITLSASPASVGWNQTSTITIVLSEASTDFSVTDITVSGGGLSAFTGSGVNYSVVFTPSVNSTDAGVIHVAADKFTDAAGNSNLASVDLRITVDTAKPSATITPSSTSLKAGDTSTVTITLTEASTNFTQADVSVVGGTLSSFTGNGINYTVVFTPTDNSTTAGKISIASDKFTDASGNANTAITSANMAIDTVKPTVTLTATESSLGAGETSVITIVLSETATDFVETDISATGGTLSAFTGSGKNYRVTFTPQIDSLVNGTVSISENKFTDAVGNGNIASDIKTYTVDTGKPTITLSASSTSLGNSQNSVITISLSEASTDFNIGDLTVSGGSLSGFTGRGIAYSVTFTPTTGSTADGSVNVSAGKFTDAAGNQNTASNTVTFTVDTAKPTATVTPNSTSLKAGETSTITIKLSETSTDFVLQDLTVSGGTLATFNGSGVDYTVVFTPTDNSTAAGSVSIAANKFTDELGNSNQASNNASLTIDTVKPTVTLTATEDSLGAGESSTITIILSESATDFSKADITVTGGTLSNFTGTGIHYSVVFTPVNVSTANGTVSISAGKFTDSAGNSNTASEVKTYTVDTAKPTITLSAVPSPTTLGKGQASIVTMVLSKTSSDFTVGDLTIVNGSLTNFQGSDKNYTVTFVPTDEFTGNGALSVLAGKFTDVSSNTNEASNVIYFDIDTQLPVIPTVEKQVTNKSKPILTGYAEDKSSVRVELKGVAFTSTPNGIENSQGMKQWSVDTSTGVDSEGKLVKFDGLPEGVYNVTVSSIDSHGNVANDQTNKELTIDLKRPIPPTLFPVFNGEIVVFNGTAEPSSWVSIKDKNDEVLCQDQPVSANGFWKCNALRSVAVGDLAVIAVKDSAQNTSQVSKVTISDNTLTRSESSSPVVFPTIGSGFITGLGEFGSGISVTQLVNNAGVNETTSVCSTLVSPMGTWKCETPNDLSSGSQFTVSQTDSNGVEIGKVITSALDLTYENEPPYLDNTNGSLLEGEVTQSGTPSVKIVKQISQDRGDIVCQGDDIQITGSINPYKYSCVKTNGALTSGDKLFAYVTITTPIQQSTGLSNMIIVGQHAKDSDLDGRTDMEEWDCHGNGTPCVDTDSDGIPNYLDVDDDGDGVLSVLENDQNYLNSDSDSDGISDGVEYGLNEDSLPNLSGIDNDSDGIDDAFDIDYVTTGKDDNGDGIVDSYQGIDTDGDGEPDYSDLDSDNDGILDSEEGHSDFDFDGIANYRDLDSDNDGINDDLERSLTVGSIPSYVTPVNSDNDNTPDYLDLDSDNDGVLDKKESGLVDLSSSLADSDADGVFDFRDLDSQGDGNFDLTESGYPLYTSNDENIDDNADGMVDAGFADTDGDGIVDVVDSLPLIFGSVSPSGLDSDNDGIFDEFDSDDDNDGIADELEGTNDTDGDGVINSRDLDSDNDGIFDILEQHPEFDSSQNGHIDSIVDVNLDGLDDRASNLMLRDTDSDGIPDILDLDSDNDTISDFNEAVGFSNQEILMALDPNDSGKLPQGTTDLINYNGSTAIRVQMLALADTDGDGIRDFQDTDSDNDGYSDKDEYLTNPTRTNNSPYTQDEIVTSPDGNPSGGSFGIVSLLGVLLLTIKRHGYRTRKSILTLFFTFTAVTATASESDNYCGYEIGADDTSCFYGIAGLGLSSLDPERSSQGWGNDPDGKESFGGSIGLGYHLSPRWFVEFDYSYLGEAELINSRYDANNPATDVYSGSESIGYHNTSLMLGGFLFSPKPSSYFNLYGKLGLGTTFNTISNDRIHLSSKRKSGIYAGAGVQFRPSKSPWFSRLEVMAYDADAVQYRLSIGYYFGGNNIINSESLTRNTSDEGTYDERASNEDNDAQALVAAETDGRVNNSEATATESSELANGESDLTENNEQVKDENASTKTSEQVNDEFSSNQNDDYLIASTGNEISDENEDANTIAYSEELSFENYQKYTLDISMFDIGSHELGNAGMYNLYQLAQLMETKKEYSVLLLGYTDSTGTEEFNMQLSEKRANEVKDYLEVLGIDPALIEVVAKGEADPIGSNLTKLGRSKNRRVDLILEWN